MPVFSASPQSAVRRRTSSRLSRWHHGLCMNITVGFQAALHVGLFFVQRCAVSCVMLHVVEQCLALTMSKPLSLRSNKIDNLVLLTLAIVERLSTVSQKLRTSFQSLSLPPGFQVWLFISVSVYITDFAFQVGHLGVKPRFHRLAFDIASTAPFERLVILLGVRCSATPVPPITKRPAAEPLEAPNVTAKSGVILRAASPPVPRPRPCSLSPLPCPPRSGAGTWALHADTGPSPPASHMARGLMQAPDGGLRETLACELVAILDFLPATVRPHRRPSRTLSVWSSSAGSCLRAPCRACSWLGFWHVGQKQQIIWIPCPRHRHIYRRANGPKLK